MKNHISHTFLLSLLFVFLGTSLLQAQGSAFGSGSFGSADGEEEPDLTTITFEETDFDFGEVKAGEMVIHTFVFTNSGENDLIIENVKPSCSCAKLEFPQGIIKPGEKGEILVHFDTAGKSGKQEKNLTIIFNGNPPIERVFFRGIVLENPDAPKENHE